MDPSAQREIDLFLSLSLSSQENHVHAAEVACRRARTTDASHSFKVTVPKATNKLKQIASSDIKLIERIGQGSRGEVWRATWKGYYTVAVKFTNERRSAVEDCERELRIFHRLQGIPYIVLLHGFYLDDGFAPSSEIAISSSIAPAILVRRPRIGAVMEFMDGDSLKAFLRNTPQLKRSERLSIVCECALAIAFFHDIPAVHGDITSSNFTVRTRGPGQAPEIKLIDFEFAEMGQQKRMAQGTHTYAAPEVLSGHPNTAASDVYSLAMLIWAIFSGEEPFSHHARFSTLAEFQVAVCKNTERPSLDCIPRGLQSLLQESWHSDPLSRSSAASLVPRLIEEMRREICAESICRKKILLCGLSGSGKSSVVRAIENLNGQEAKFSSTTDVMISKDNHVSIEERQYVLDIFDTVGLDSRGSLAHTLVHIIELLPNDLNEINKAVFCVRADRHRIRLTEELKCAYSFFKLLGGKPQNFLICITFIDFLNDATVRAFVEQLVSIPQLDWIRKDSIKITHLSLPNISEFPFDEDPATYGETLIARSRGRLAENIVASNEEKFFPHQKLLQLNQAEIDEFAKLLGQLDEEDNVQARNSRSNWIFQWLSWLNTSRRNAHSICKKVIEEMSRMRECQA